MKRVMRLTALVAMIATVLVGCTENSLDNIKPGQETTIKLGYAEFSASLSNGTKVELGDDTATTTPIYWNENDTIIIIVEGSEYTFAIKDFTEGQTTATFYCNEAPTSLKAGTYVAYHKDGKAINFASQSGLREDIGDVISMEGTFTLAEGEGWSDVDLTFNANVSVIKLTLSHNNFKGAEVSGVTLKNDGTAVATATSTFTGDSTNGAIEVYFAVEPQEFSNTTIEATCGDVYHKAEMTNSNTLKAGKLYRISKHMGAKVIVSDGNCGAQGDNVTYELYYYDYTQTKDEMYNCFLIFSGTGAIADYGVGYILDKETDTYSYTRAPWMQHMPLYGEEMSNGIKNVKIGEGITHIGAGSLAHLLDLYHLQIPGTLKSIGSEAFVNSYVVRTDIANLDAWYEIELSDIYSSPFGSLYVDGIEVTNLVIPESVTVIKDYLFTSCQSLETLTIHEGVTEIGDFAFRNCSNLFTINCHRTTPPIGGEKMFFYEYIYEKGVINVPEEAVEAYKAAAGWSVFQHKIQGVNF